MGMQKHAKRPIVSTGHQLLQCIKSGETAVKIPFYAYNTVAKKDADGKVREYLPIGPFNKKDCYYKVMAIEHHNLNPHLTGDNCVVWTLTDEYTGMITNSEAVKMVMLPQSKTLPFVRRIFTVHNENKTHKRLVIEQTRGTLGVEDYLEQMSAAGVDMSLDEWRSLVCQMLYGLYVLHDSGIMHSDLNRSNIMLRIGDVHKNTQYEVFHAEGYRNPDFLDAKHHRFSTDVRMQTDVEGKLINIPLFNNGHILLIDYDLSVLFNQGSVQKPRRQEWAPSSFTPTFDLLYLMQTWSSWLTSFSCLTRVHQWMVNFEEWVAHRFGITRDEMERIYVQYHIFTLPSLEKCKLVHIPISNVIESFFADYYEQ